MLSPFLRKKLGAHCNAEVPHPVAVPAFVVYLKSVSTVALVPFIILSVAGGMFVHALQPGDP